MPLRQCTGSNWERIERRAKRAAPPAEISEATGKELKEYWKVALKSWGIETVTAEATGKELKVFHLFLRARCAARS
jgi:hypothetical protein